MPKVKEQRTRALSFSKLMLSFPWCNATLSNCTDINCDVCGSSANKLVFDVGNKYLFTSRYKIEFLLVLCLGSRVDIYSAGTWNGGLYIDRK